ncbi:MAG: hypothetical protein LBB79_06105 [Prevotellaceae bacterium]|jgi:hypothetical protein|nr:hypothetical protein [Prevotellaceae bacterium]
MREAASLTFIPVGGLANRVNAIGAAIRLCADHNKKLKIFWFKDWGMGAGFHDLFTLSEKAKDVTVIDAQWYHYLYDRPHKYTRWLPRLYQRLKFDALFYAKSPALLLFQKWFPVNFNKRSLYVTQYLNFYTNSDNSFYLHPTEAIRSKIETRLSTLPSRTIGIHIRRTDMQKSIVESPTTLFIEKMKSEIAADPTTCFYVASDSVEEKKALIDLWGDKIITRENFVRRDTKEGIIEAVVELYTLASTQKIYGSSGSSYSMLASELKNTPIEILTQC